MWITIDFSTIYKKIFLNMFKTISFPQFKSAKPIKFSTKNKVFHNFVDNSKKALVYSLLGVLVFTSSINALAFNKELVLDDSQLYSLPVNFDSSDKIQKYLESKNSILANYNVNISFESDDDLIDPAKYTGVADKYNLLKNYGPRFGTNIKFSQLIWELSRTRAANGCSFKSTQLCYDNETKPLNPAYLLAVVQKESGLVYGANAKLDPNSDKAKFLLDRVTGYACLENREKGCFDENPKWRYYKGAFRQLYYTVRFTGTRVKSCQDNISPYKVGDSVFVVGNEVSVNNRVNGVSSIEKVRLGNAITCALYIYTPHITAQKLLSDTFSYIQGPITSVIPPTPTPVVGTPAQIVITQPTVVAVQAPSKPVEKSAEKSAEKPQEPSKKRKKRQTRKQKKASKKSSRKAPQKQKIIRRKVR